ncbi:hypothetical protein DPMN_036587 [Dreissena polymorpha]|uniref:Uncharacterized protein n=1 Tax=Dreissena polymorpha TaxID=45954 RepID=A0A9D4MAZ6_DREPO|nr:hypothetical protein DPMN_036587 [Dreissena polymorpha]
MKEHTLGCYPLTVAALGFHQDNNYKDTGAMYTVTEKLSLPLLWKRIRNESRFRCPLGPRTAHSKDRVRDMQPQGHNTGSSPRTSQNTQRGKNTFAMCAKPPINI